jgi:predicted RNA binding protein YcfA (HicA-like mRNA interferase family)
LNNEGQLDDFLPCEEKMTKKAKLLKRIRANPKDVDFSEVRELLKDAGFNERQPKGGSSHYIYYHESLDRIVSLTKGSKRLPEYQVKDALRAMQKLEGKYEKG